MPHYRYPQNPAYPLFLTSFFEPRVAQLLPVMTPDDWKGLLQEDPLHVTKSFLDNELITQTSLVDVTIRTVSYDELSWLAMQRGATAVSNEEQALVFVLKTDYKPNWQTIYKLPLLECSPEGANVVGQFVEEVKQQGVERALKEIGLPDTKWKRYAGSFAKYLGLAITAGVVGFAAVEPAKDLWQEFGYHEQQRTLVPAYSSSDLYHFYQPAHIPSMQLDPVTPLLLTAAVAGFSVSQFIQSLQTGKKSR
jgi:hypothetical protein